MNRTLLIVLTVVVLSIVAYFIMLNFFAFSQEKALWIAGGAGAAMIFFDVVLVKLFRKS